jgi:hypothetical protein
MPPLPVGYFVNVRNEQAQSELNAFSEFVKCTGVPVLPDTCLDLRAFPPQRRCARREAAIPASWASA